MNVNVMVAGAQKAGTSSLKYYLQQHPGISSHMNLECDYFTSNHDNYDGYFRQYFQPSKRLILAKHAGLYKEESYIRKLQRHNPYCKIIFVIREPIERLISAYNMGIKSWIDFDPESFIEALNANAKGEYNVAFNTLIKLGDYGRAAKLLYQYFPHDQVVFVSFNDLKNNTRNLCKTLYQFIGVDDEFVPDISRKNIAYTQRSKIYAQVFLRLQQSRLKIYAKRILPYRHFLNISKHIEKLNRKEGQAVDKDYFWDEDVLSDLSNYYDRTNKQFEKVTGLRSREFFVK